MGLLPVEVALLVLLTGSHGMSATCMGRKEHIQRYLISSQPPYDNYYNISKAVYPSVDLPFFFFFFYYFATHNELQAE